MRLGAKGQKGMLHRIFADSSIVLFGLSIAIGRPLAARITGLIEIWIIDKNQRLNRYQDLQ